MWRRASSRPAWWTDVGELARQHDHRYQLTLRKAGLLWIKYNKHVGLTDMLVIKAPTRVPNPAIDQSFIDQALADDPISARAKMQLSKDSQLLSSGGTIDSISSGVAIPRTQRDHAS